MGQLTSKRAAVSGSGCKTYWDSNMKRGVGGRGRYFYRELTSSDSYVMGVFPAERVVIRTCDSTGEVISQIEIPLDDFRKMVNEVIYF